MHRTTSLDEQTRVMIVGGVLEDASRNFHASKTGEDWHRNLQFELYVARILIAQIVGSLPRSGKHGPSAWPVIIDIADMRRRVDAILECQKDADPFPALHDSDAIINYADEILYQWTGEEGVLGRSNDERDLIRRSQESSGDDDVWTSRVSGRSPEEEGGAMGI